MSVVGSEGVGGQNPGLRPVGKVIPARNCAVVGREARV